MINDRKGITQIVNVARVGESLTTHERGVIRSGFVWEATLQGHYFWLEVAQVGGIYTETHRQELIDMLKQDKGTSQ